MQSDSEYLRAYRENPNLKSERTDGEVVRHFEIICDEGSINIIASTWSCTLKEEMPAV